MFVTRYNQILAKIHEGLRFEQLNYSLSAILALPPDQDKIKSLESSLTSVFVDILENLGRLKTDPEIRQVMEMLGINKAFSGDRISEIMMRANQLPDAAKLRNGPTGNDLFEMWSIVRNLEIHRSCFFEKLLREKLEVPPKLEELRLILPEAKHGGIDLDNLNDLIVAIQSLSYQISELLYKGHQPVWISRWDTGSKLEIHLRGFAKSVRAIGAVLKFTFNKRYREQDLMFRDIEVAERMLGISEAFQAAGIDADPKKLEGLQDGILESSNNVIRSGAVTDEIEQEIAQRGPGGRLTWDSPRLLEHKGAEDDHGDSPPAIEDKTDKKK